MEVGDIVRIDGCKPMQVVYDKYGCMLKNNCSIYDKCPIKNKGCYCLAPLALEYGKLYRCSEVMPEDFEDFDFKQDIVVRTHNERKRLQIERRVLTAHRKEWLYHFDSDITHWLAIPPINE